jgi:hypothetical protein
MATPEENKALARRFYEEIGKDNVDAVDKLAAEGYINHDPPPFLGLAPGQAGLKLAFEMFWKATPGHHVIEDQIAEGDKVVTRLRGVGKHVADLAGIPPSGLVTTWTSRRWRFIGCGTASLLNTGRLLIRLRS